MKKALSLPLACYKKTKKLIDRTANWVILKHKDVQYVSFPQIKGRIKLYGEGHFNFGNSLKFNCSIESNFVGLYKTCTIAVVKGATLTIGDHSGFSGVSIYCTTRISIGEHVNCGGNVCIWDTDFHPLQHEERRVHNVAEIRNAPIAIGNDVFIGANSIILKGVIIGDRSIIGAGSVVTKTIPPDEVWAGNPAKFIRKHRVNL